MTQQEILEASGLLHLKDAIRSGKAVIDIASLPASIRNSVAETVLQMIGARLISLGVDIEP
jgi:hypothetical protein